MLSVQCCSEAPKTVENLCLLGAGLERGEPESTRIKLLIQQNCFH